MVKGTIRIETDLIIGQIAGRGNLNITGGDPDLSKVIEGTIVKNILEDTVDKIAEGSIDVIAIGIVVIIEAG